MKTKTNKPLFIVVEGGDGVGKGTQIEMLKTWLYSLGFRVEYSREPGGSPVGEEIRSIMSKYGGGKEISPITELLLFIAGRFQHGEAVIKRFLKFGLSTDGIPSDRRANGRDVLIVDRYFLSTYAYQMCGRNLKEDDNCLNFFEAHVDALKEQGMIPDLFLIFDLDPEIAKQRPSGRPDEKMGFDDLGMIFKHRVRDGMIDYAKLWSQAHVIDASGTVGEIFNQVKEVIEPLLED